MGPVEYVIVTAAGVNAPVIAAVATPVDAPIATVAGELLFHMPPPTVLVRVEVAPWQISGLPAIAAGAEFTVTIRADGQVKPLTA